MSAAASVDPVLLFAAASVAGGLAVAAPWEVAAVFLAVSALVLASGRVRRWTLVGAAVALGVGAVRARAAVACHEVERTATEAALGHAARCSSRARVVSSPVTVRGTTRWDADLDHLICTDGTSPWLGRATLYGGPGDLARGDEVDVVATLAMPQRFWNASTGDPRPADARRGSTRSGGVLDARLRRHGVGLLASVDRIRAGVRARIEATFNPDVAPMARALVLGENDLAPDDDRAFRVSGLSHLLAVSGMHLVLVVALVVRAIAAVLARIERLAGVTDVGRLVAAIGLPLTWVYAEFAGAGGSTVRAAWMMTAALFARVLGRQSDPVRSFALSVLAMAASDPLVAYDLSFTLSAAATSGLLAFGAPLKERIGALVPPRMGFLAGAVATTIAASIPCAPILARFAPTAPVGGVLANLIAVPLGEWAALPLCLAHALLREWPDAERGCALVASGALTVVRWIARGFATPALTLEVPQPTSWQLAILALAMAALVLRCRRWRVTVAALCATLLALELGARRGGSPRGTLRATMLDVGQGDAALVDLPDGEIIVIDGGGLVGSPIDVGMRVLAPELRARRRNRVAAVVLTHPHPDHFGGLVTGLDGIEVGELWDSGQGELERTGGGYETLLERARSQGVPVLRPDRLCGSRWLGGARIDVLAPCPEANVDRGPNDNSLVLRIGYGARSLLFVGDAELAEEQELLTRTRDMLGADVLKVGHHGSRTSSSARFVDTVRPRHAIISVGSRNRFGHPDPLTLSTLVSAGARVWRTDLDGAITVQTDGASLEVRSIARAAPP